MPFDLKAFEISFRLRFVHFISSSIGLPAVWFFKISKKTSSIFSRLKLIWADAGYSGKLVEWVKITCGWVLEIVERKDNIKEFQVLPHRWIVEWTFGWLGRYRRLSKDYEGLTESSQALIYVAMIRIMIKRIANIKN